MYGLRAYAFSGTAVVGCATGLRHAGCARCVILLQSSPCCDSWQRQVVHLWSPCWSPFGCMLLQSSVRAELCQCRFWSFAVRSLFSYMPSKFWRTGSSLGCMFHAPLAVLPEGALNVHPFCWAPSGRMLCSPFVYAPPHASGVLCCTASSGIFVSLSHVRCVLSLLSGPSRASVALRGCSLLCQAVPTGKSVSLSHVRCVLSLLSDPSRASVALRGCSLLRRTVPSNLPHYEITVYILYHAPS